MYEENTLSHHGIKGQKWGIRRFQNADGSLTDRGRKRYNKAVYKEVITRTELGRSMVKGKLMSEVVNDIRPSYKKFKSSIDVFESEVEKIKKSESYKKELNKIKSIAKKGYVEIEEKTLQEQLAFEAAEKTSGYKKAKTKLEKETTDYLKIVTEKVEDSLGKYRNVKFDKIALGDKVSVKIDRYLKEEIPDVPTRGERISAERLNRNHIGEVGAIAGGIIASARTGLSPFVTGAIAGIIHVETSSATKYMNSKYEDYDEKD